MVDLPKRKVGIISCSGEELAEGTVSRVATRWVLERLRQEQTVTLCLPLFLAGGKEERAFAKFYPTIAVDGCSKLCAAKATAAYSAEPAARIVVSDIAARYPELKPDSRRQLGPGGMELARKVAEEIAARVDEILARPARANVVRLSAEPQSAVAPAGACSCQSGGIPTRVIQVGGAPVAVTALDAILNQMAGITGEADAALRAKLLQMVQVYNAIPADQEAQYAEALWREFVAHRALTAKPS
ncbi:MAG: putative zinc-binding protein [Anaerolineae bacterium]